MSKKFAINKMDLCIQHRLVKFRKLKTYKRGKYIGMQVKGKSGGSS